MPQIISKRIPYVGNIYDTQPVGEVIQCERETTPAGYIELTDERQSVLRSKYPELFKQIGTTYGAEDDEHFNLPSKNESGSVTEDKTNNLIDSFIKNTTIFDTGLLNLGDGQTATVTLNNSRQYLYVNVHATFNTEVVLLRAFGGLLYKTVICGSGTIISNSYQNVTFQAPGNCRGYLFQFGELSTT